MTRSITSGLTSAHTVPITGEGPASLPRPLPTLQVGPGPSGDLIRITWQLHGRPVAWIQRTDDLVSWSDWLQVTSDGSQLDTAAARRFYRFRITQP